ncbi:hypothetical protein [Mycobacteroides abscessus]|uniref:hypothetical protein n=1 Tax=Mycobacteroides abscessus TaxID=36809 RepID=UPI0013F660D0|nr:hypothetical protein [Mycobacteroides abscessus]
MEHTIDVTPDHQGTIRWAQKVLAEAPEGSNDARTARKVLAEFGVEPSSGIEPD